MQGPILQAQVAIQAPTRPEWDTWWTVNRQLRQQPWCTRGRQGNLVTNIHIRPRPTRNITAICSPGKYFYTYYIIYDYSFKCILIRKWVTAVKTLHLNYSHRWQFFDDLWIAITCLIKHICETVPPVFCIFLHQKILASFCCTLLPFDVIHPIFS